MADRLSYAFLNKPKNTAYWQGMQFANQALGSGQALEIQSL